MARITISEQDLTVNDFEDITANVVYVPGIATMGPLNTPILCTTIKDFQKSFGNMPYMFAEDQDVNGEIITQGDEYERSYIYACELIQAGFQVLFERVLDQYVLDGCEYTWEEQLGESVITASNFIAYKYYTYDGDSTYTLADKFEDGVSYFLPQVATQDAVITETFYGKLLGDYSNTNNIIPSVFDKLQDKWTYNLKFITSGSYPILEYQSVNQADYGYGAGVSRPIMTMMAMIAAIRGDAIALIDHKLDIENITSVYDDINTVLKYTSGNTSMIKQCFTLKTNVVDERLFSITYSTPDNRLEELSVKYMNICSPWGIYTLQSTPGIAATTSGTFKFPGSFAYLKSLANSINKYKNPNYIAVAGVVRGLVPSLQQLCTQVTGAEAEAVQVRTKEYSSINPIVNVQNYGLCIWGNRTLFPNTSSSENPDGELSASSFLNIRVMAADVKKVIYAACKKYTFETNNTELWLKFKSDVEPTLEQMVANGGLEDYELQRRDTTQRATLSVYVKLYTLYAVEDFDITIALTDSTVDQVQ